jgi:hypothetical protein
MEYSLSKTHRIASSERQPEFEESMKRASLLAVELLCENMLLLYDLERNLESQAMSSYVMKIVRRVATCIIY